MANTATTESGAKAVPDRQDGRGDFSDYFSATERRRPHKHYGRFVGVSKILLFSLAVGLIMALMIWPQFTKKDNLVEVGVSKDVEPEDIASLRVTRARLTGASKDGKPYTVTFEMASQTRQDSDLVTVVAPQADIELKDGAWVAVSGRSGRYHREKRIMELDAPVQLFHDSGLELSTGSMTFNLLTGTGAGHDPLHAQAPFGQLDSRGFRIRDDAAIFQFTGPVRAILYGPPSLGE